MNPVESHIVFRANDEMISLMDSNPRVELYMDSQGNEDPGRLFDIRIGDYQSKAILLDLPTITETQKTLDGINFFKVADLCQLLYVIPRSELPNYRERGTSVSRMLDSESRYCMKSGLTPPTYNITNVFFKREVKENVARVKDVEKRIKRAMEQKASKNVQTQLLEFSDEESIPKDFEQTIAAEEEPEEHSSQAVLR